MLRIVRNFNTFYNRFRRSSKINCQFQCQFLYQCLSVVVWPLEAKKTKQSRFLGFWQVAKKKPKQSWLFGLWQSTGGGATVVHQHNGTGASNPASKMLPLLAFANIYLWDTFQETSGSVGPYLPTLPPKLQVTDLLASHWHLPSHVKLFPEQILFHSVERPYFAVPSSFWVKLCWCKILTPTATALNIYKTWLTYIICRNFHILRIE